jgi:hypothetical protein
MCQRLSVGVCLHACVGASAGHRACLPQGSGHVLACMCNDGWVPARVTLQLCPRGLADPQDVHRRPTAAAAEPH